MPLYFIGLGLTPNSLTLESLEVIKRCQKVFLDMYTSILISYEQMCDLMQKTLKREDVIQVDRQIAETASDTIVEPAKTQDVAFLVVGDALVATTHSDLYMRAVKAGVSVHVYHNASITNAISSTGVSIYNVGRTISVPFFDGNWRPSSFLEKILINHKNGMHSLLLLDIKTHELSLRALMKGVERHEPPRYMTCAVACQQIMQLLDSDDVEHESVKKQAIEAKFTPETPCIACMRVGTPEQRFIYASIAQMATLDDEMGAPLHSLLILADELTELEKEMFELWRWKQ